MKDADKAAAANASADPPQPARTLQQSQKLWREQRRQRWLRAGRRLRHSVKGRLVLLFVLLALATSTVFLVGMQRAVQGGWQAYAKPLVADYLDRLAAEIGSPPDAARAAAIVQRLPLKLRIEGPVLQYDSHREERSRRRFDPDAHEFDAAAWGLVRQTGDGHRITFGLAEPSRSWRQRGIGWLTLATLLLLTAAAYLGVSRMLRPLRDIGAGVEAYGRGEFGQPIAVRRDDELGALARRVNSMASSLHGMLEAKRALLLAISHELRSPLTRARLNAELLAETPERAALLRDLNEMRELITGLLESERLAMGHSALQSEATDLVALVRELAQTSFGGRELHLNLDASIAPARVDPMRVRLLLRNLIDNALRHGAAGTAPIEVFLRREDAGRLALGVRDRGPGVSAEQLAHLGEAFYRPDSARSRAAGGVGLGLHLCRLVARAHGGELRLRGAEPGLEAAMLWPS